jgi:hypothetical protein
MSTVAGGESAETPFTLGLSTGAIINGTEFVRPFGLPADAPRLAGTLRFDAPTIAVADGFAPFVFNGLVSGFAHDDVEARAPLFQVALTGQGTARLGLEDFDNLPLLGSAVIYTFAAAPAATPEPTTLVLFGTAVAGLVQRARKKATAK